MEEELVKLREALQGHNEVMRRLHEGQGNTNTQNMTIHYGTKAMWVAVWLATTACLIMYLQGQQDRDKLAAMQIQLIDTSRKLDVAQDKLSIVLQWAPTLRDEVNKEMTKKEKAP